MTAHILRNGFLFLKTRTWHTVSHGEAKLNTCRGQAGPEMGQLLDKGDPARVGEVLTQAQAHVAMWGLGLKEQIWFF